MKAEYEYIGPVSSFNDILNFHWHGSTIAKSEKKALSNLAYRYKKERGWKQNKKVSLDPGCLRVVRTIDDEGYYGTVEDYIEGRVDY